MTRYRTHITEECVVPVPAAKKALQKHIVKSSGLPLSIYARLVIKYYPIRTAARFKSTSRYGEALIQLL